MNKWNNTHLVLVDEVDYDDDEDDNNNSRADDDDDNFDDYSPVWHS